MSTSSVRPAASASVSASVSAAASVQSRLDRLQPIAASHPAARRYSQARRHVLPGREHVTAVAGRWAHQQLAGTDAVVDTVLWCPGPAPSADLLDAAGTVASRSSTAYTISERTLSRIHPGLTAPNVVSVVRLPTWSPRRLLGRDARLLLVADGIEYAGNLGTLIRTADACGADGLVLTSVEARLSHPKVFVASRGTVLTTPVLGYDDVAEARRDLGAAGFTVYVADPAAAASYREVDYAGRRAAFVVGSEGEGVGPEWRSPELTRVSIPMLGQADSLNVAVSAAILLFEARAQLDSLR